MNGWMDDMKVLAIVPSFNEEKNIATVIESIKNENSMIDILIINDGRELLIVFQVSGHITKKRYTFLLTIIRLIAHNIIEH